MLIDGKNTIWSEKTKPGFISPVKGHYIQIIEKILLTSIIEKDYKIAQNFTM